MEIVLVVAGTFLLCWLADKGFTKLFRSEPQHMSGKSVRLNKYYGVGGIVLIILGVAALFSGYGQDWTLFAGGVLLVAVGICFAVYYVSFGVFYDEDSFALATFGKRNAVYRYGDIRGQLLYNSFGKIIIELHMANGRTLQLQSSMIGVYPFLDTAYAGWVQQTGRQESECSFHDPDNSCWFPNMGD